MYIDESVLREYLEDPKKFEALCKQKRELYDRYFEIAEIVKDFKDQKVNGKIQCGWGQGEGSGRESYETAKNNYSDDAVKMWKLIGGYDKNEKPRDIFRIISASKGKNENYFENENYSTIGTSLYSNSNFASNNSPSNIQKFLQVCVDAEFEQAINESMMVLTWQSNNYLGDTDHFGESKKRLETRFPLKFLWMWANQDEVIHSLSLMAFREFLKSDFMTQIFRDLKAVLENNGLGADISEYAKKITNYKFDKFGKIWKMISEKIVDNFGNLENKQILIEGQTKEIEAIQQISLLISLLTLGETDMTNIDELLKTHKQIILYGVPGTGKTHSAKELIRKWSQEEFEDVEKSKRDQDEIDRLQLSKLLLDSENSENVESKQDGGKKIERDIKIVWEIMQFHPNTTYQDFIGGIVPKTDGKGSLSYELRDGKFKEFCEYARVNPKIPFVFIIDEINRANLSEVLGELLYALEYRDEGITIPNFNKPFVIPNNVYIIGTMNNVDKSLSTFDLALRRRFGFYEIKPDLGTLNEILSFEVENQNNSVNDKAPGTRVPLISEMENYITRCKNLNKKIIEKLGDKNAQIGQAYYGKIEHFLNKNKEDQVVTPFHLQKLWNYHLEPLLQEYVGFMDDGEKKVEDLKKVWLGKVEE